MNKKRFQIRILYAMLACLPLTTTAQGIHEDVVLEISTGTWCTFCPGAALGANDLMAAGAHAGIVEHHEDDQFEHPASESRLDYHLVTGYPTAFFDGLNPYIGGHPSVSVYPMYNNLYQEAKVVTTPFNLRAKWAQNGPSIDVEVTVYQLGAYAGNNMRIQAALTESELMVNWYGLTKCDFVSRSLYPDHNGVPITISQGGPSVVQNFNLAIDPLWNQQNMELVVWLEDSITHQIFNGKRLPLAQAMLTTDIAVTEGENWIAAQSCITDIAPQVVIHNTGTTTLTNGIFTYEVNGNPPATLNWTGNLPYGGWETITLPNYNFLPQPTNILSVTMTVPTDGNPANNLANKTWLGATTNPSGTYMVRIKPDNYGFQITWDIKNSAGTIVASGGPFAIGDHNISNVPVTLGMNDCFTYSIHDSVGNGLGIGISAGWFQVEAPNGDTIYRRVGDFGFLDQVDFKTDNTVSSVLALDEGFGVFPNPSLGVFEVWGLVGLGEEARLTVFNMQGQLVFHCAAISPAMRIDLSDRSAGLYLLQIQTEKGTVVKRLEKL